jgi:hypothetical protein
MPKALPVPTNPAAEIAELRNAIRQGHELLRDLRTAVREAKEYEDRICTERVYKRIEDAVSKGLAEYRKALNNAIEGATQATYDRFDLLAAITLGTDAQNIRNGGEPTAELFKRYLNLHPEILLELSSVKAKGTAT